MTKIVIKHQEKYNHNQNGGTKDCDNNFNCVWVFFFFFLLRLITLTTNLFGILDTTKTIAYISYVPEREEF